MIQITPQVQPRDLYLLFIHEWLRQLLGEDYADLPQINAKVNNF